MCQRDDDNTGIISGDVSAKATYNWQAKGG
jgi:hypothetical protein